MGPKPAEERSDHDLFRTELVNLIDQRHELVKLAALIDWQAFADKWNHSSSPRPGGLRCPRSSWQYCCT